MLEDVYRKFPREAALIGRVLLSYGVLELDLLNCVASATKDFNLTLKSMFIPKGETARIKIARELGRKAFKDQGLYSDFERAVKGMFNCVGIRNKYAHGVWHDDNSGVLSFVDLEEPSQDDVSVDHLRDLTKFDVTEDILKAQLAYFDYVSKLLRYSGMEVRKRRGEVSVSFAKPGAVSAPPALKKRRLGGS